jgi:RHS repeat-associated protein
VRTTYEYDPLTFRLVQLRTRRDPGAFPGDCPQPPPADWPGCNVQNLHYTYDPAGNITHIRDDAQQAVFFRNRRVEPSAEYTYDAVYRLIEATGREHLGQLDAAASYDDRPRVGLLHPHDGTAMATYLERYRYDEVGNMLQLIHRSGDAAHQGWTRTFTYDEQSQLDPAARSNRLTRATVGGVTETYSAGGDGYDPLGAMLYLPQLSAMDWDFAGRLRMTRRRKVDDTDDDGARHDGERTYYVYDSTGVRVRKVTESAPGRLAEERRYVGGSEFFRASGDAPLTRETLHIVDGKRRIALVETRTDTDAPEQRTRYQLGNHLDSAVLELDEQAQVISYEEYTPYGDTSLRTVRDQAQVAKRYRYTARERDAESGLCHHGARYYAPWLARWTAPDPVGTEPHPEQRPVNLYTYVGDHPTSLVDPDGRQGHSAIFGLLFSNTAAGEVAAGRATAGTGSGSGTGSRDSGAGGSGAPPPTRSFAPPPAKKGQGSQPGFFDTIANGLQSIAGFIRDWLPGLIAAPLAGLVDILAGFTRIVGGVFSWKGETVVQGLKEIGVGALATVGLDAATEQWVSTKGELDTSVEKAPASILKDLVYVRTRAHAIKAWENGWHAWHAGSNAAMAGRGILSAIGSWVLGLYHETPFDTTSWKHEQHAQGTVNHLLDSTGDLVANTLGILLGLILPRRLAIPAAVRLGNYIPGPTDPWRGKAGLYKGNPADNWGPYFQ